jgi:mannan endo-1,4-beta-mannosidase
LYSLSGYLNVVGKDFSYKNKRLFLSGANIAYNELESHFGSEQYDNQKMETLLKGIADSRGNSVRIFLKNDRVLDGIEGAKILYPIIRDLKEFLKAAQKRNILVIICLWSVEMNEQELNKLIKNRDLHDGYLRNYLRPIVEAISHYNALGAWDIIDEPEKLVAITSGDLSPCDHFSNGDTLSPIGDKLTLESVLNFIGLHLSVIKTVSPRKLTTVTISDDFANLDSCPNCFNYVRDDCFRIPGFKNETGLDFYSINWKTDKTNVKEKITKNDKPVLISRYVVKSDQKFYVTAYDYNFAGILGWDYDSSKKAEIDEEMKQSFDKYRPIQILPDIQ